MANFNFDSNADGEWDDSWETIWNEGDWERYLQSEEGKYLNINVFMSNTAKTQID